MLCYCDETDTLTWGDNDEGEYFFYYTPSYPWDRRDNEPQIIEEVHARIIAAIQRICDLSSEHIKRLIDNEVHEYGCG